VTSARRALLGVALAVLAPPLAAAQANDAHAGDRATYAKYCAQCHGDKGDGNGPAAAHLLPKPRDFTTGKYKLRTTPSDALPVDGDIRRAIREGMPYTSMPPWPQLSDADVDGLVAYLKSFHDGFADPNQAAKPIDLPRAPASTKESVEKGKQLYASLGCARCHGESGRGDGPSAPTLKDDKGDPIRAADLSERWTFRGGPRREDIFRTFSTGLNGTPMPSFYDSLKEDERWALTDFVYSLGDGDAPGYTSVVVAAPLEEDFDPARADELFRSVAQARLALVGQVIEPGRAFAPAATSLQVRAVYDQQRIVLRVSWHDARRDVAGRSDPAAQVPLAEEAIAAQAAPAGGAGGFWGEEEAPAAPAGGAPAPSAQGGDFWGEEEAAAPAGTAPAAEFPDAVAIQLPQELPEGVAKPYFLFGDGQLPVDLWFFDLSGQAVRQYVGRGSGALTALEGGEVSGQARYDAGEWSVVFSRELRATTGVSFAEGSYVPIAFSVWDGTSRERGSRRALTQWVYVYLEPREKPSPVVPMLTAGLSVLALELVVVGAIRRRARRPRAA
jgi:mono/diheme cytochrome c family protein